MIAYVSTTGNDDTAQLNNPRRPFRTIDQANNAIFLRSEPNWTMLIDEGTYTDTTAYIFTVQNKNLTVKPSTIGAKVMHNGHWAVGTNGMVNIQNLNIVSNDSVPLGTDDNGTLSLTNCQVETIQNGFAVGQNINLVNCKLIGNSISGGFTSWFQGNFNVTGCDIRVTKSGQSNYVIFESSGNFNNNTFNIKQTNGEVALVAQSFAGNNLQLTNNNVIVAGSPTTKLTIVLFGGGQVTINFMKVKLIGITPNNVTIKQIYSISGQLIIDNLYISSPDTTTLEGVKSSVMISRPVLHIVKPVILKREGLPLRAKVALPLQKKKKIQVDSTRATSTVALPLQKKKHKIQAFRAKPSTPDDSTRAISTFTLPLQNKIQAETIFTKLPLQKKKIQAVRAEPSTPDDSTVVLPLESTDEKAAVREIQKLCQKHNRFALSPDDSDILCSTAMHPITLVVKDDHQISRLNIRLSDDSRHPIKIKTPDGKTLYTIEVKNNH